MKLFRVMCLLFNVSFGGVGIMCMEQNNSYNRNLLVFLGILFVVSAVFLYLTSDDD